MTAAVVAAVAACVLVPAALGALARSVRTFRVVLLLGLAPALWYWIEVALVDPSYDLTRTGQLLAPGVYAVLLVGVWCLLAYSGRTARRVLGRRRASVFARDDRP